MLKNLGQKAGAVANEFFPPRVIGLDARLLGSRHLAENLADAQATFFQNRLAPREFFDSRIDKNQIGRFRRFKNFPRNDKNPPILADLRRRQSDAVVASRERRAHSAEQIVERRSADFHERHRRRDGAQSSVITLNNFFRIHKISLAPTLTIKEGGSDFK